jgi:hypothetical protein
MVILVPWKPVALVPLSALIFVSYYGSALMHGQDPFTVNTGNSRDVTAQHVGGSINWCAQVHSEGTD